MDMQRSPVDGDSLRLASGIEVLDDWARTATPMSKTAIYEVLFAVSDKSVCRDYITIDDIDSATDFFVLTGCGLAVKIRLYSLESFGIVYVGSALCALKPEA